MQWFLWIKALWIMDLTLSKGFRQTVFLVPVALFPSWRKLPQSSGRHSKGFCKEHEKCINCSRSVTSYLLLFIIMFSNRNRRCCNYNPQPPTDPSPKVSGIVLCSMVCFCSVPGGCIATSTLGGIRIKKRRKGAHSIEDRSAADILTRGWQPGTI